MFYSKIQGLVIVLCAILSLNLYATSLFDESSFNSLTADKRAMSVGDTVTVIVLENAQAKSRSGTSNANDLSISATGSSPQGTWPHSLGIGAEYSGDAITSRNGYIKAQITAIVSEIDLHGNLVIQGAQNITIDGELQSIELSGRVRAVDIMANNTLLSSRIMNAKINFTGDEPESEGMLSQLFTWLGF
ncbi:Flagellar L-ring protein [Pseudoalteromonas holothuriae]|uniref:Flagellar L-ring protein n=1 Tax=Pseudoalteromonas holothuriae TaxID=2963714 RepID=A0A9W4R129_9GAMM|nr:MULTISPECIES: flagellar basal body L-ring protein FlgH [unclassified Pseudoalteromonas]CAH9051015.1 Flagellar L-ring protein [Pseudoalteromonas sp. CIP111951]CAH9061674.1 Flagellar L-ring protein [Pseudoalteromonas sp. CIP111854]